LSKEAGIEEDVVPDTVTGVVTVDGAAPEALGATVVKRTTTATPITAAGVATRARAAERALPERIGLSIP
jgi:hypothetical protein